MRNAKIRKYPELRKLKARMVEVGETYRTLSEKTNISLTTLNNKINGYSQFNLPEVFSICSVLKISSEQLEYFFN